MPNTIEVLRTAFQLFVAQGVSMLVLLGLFGFGELTADEVAAINAFTGTGITLLFLFWKQRRVADALNEGRAPTELSVNLNPLPSARPEPTIAGTKEVPIVEAPVTVVTPDDNRTPRRTTRQVPPEPPDAP